MRYKIVVDSCCELPVEYKDDPRFERIPLTLEVGDYRILDDETFNQREFLDKVAAYPKCPKSACPSPERYRDAFAADADHIYCVTLSSHLSGSYNSAELGKKMYHDEYGEKNIFVCDSESASCGETQLAFKAAEWSKQGLAFEEICRRLRDYRDKMKTYFVLDNLETLRKNGRLTGIKAVVASLKGEIIQLGQAIGSKKALAKMAETIADEAVQPQERTLMITHCNCKERAEKVKEMILDKIKVKDVVIMDTQGVSSMYANDGGVIVTL